MTGQVAPIAPHATPVSLRSVQRIFDHTVEAVADISLEIAAGEFLAILGPSGCGKSTLLRLVAGLDHPTRGSVRLGDNFPRNQIAYVFQDAHLLPWRNVLQNVALPLELQGAGKSHRIAAAADALQRVGLTDAVARYPAQLSGGMKMRVSLARALVTRPRLLLLDEPFAALDEITRQHLDEQLRDLWMSLGMTVLFVTHSTAEAIFLADRAVVLTRRPARIVTDIPIDLPPKRDAAIRSTSKFAAMTKSIYDALQQGGA
jgi:NitT/TauT family transport system ATP-binding protein